MVSGDDQLESEIRTYLPWARYAMVKNALGPLTAERLADGEAARRIESAAREALLHLDQARLPDWPSPYLFSLRFQDEQQAWSAALARDTEPTDDGRGVQIRTDDHPEGYRLAGAAIQLAFTVGVSTATWAVIDRQPNAEALTQAVMEEYFGRLAAQQSTDISAGAPAPRGQRYWGSR